jgi:hypothetical protein
MNFAATHILEGVEVREEEVLMVSGVQSTGGKQVVTVHLHHAI